MKKMLMSLISLVLLSFISGCAGTMNAINNTEMTTKVKMSESIMLDVMNSEKNRSAYVSVKNTSDMQEINFEQQLKSRLISKGIQIAHKPDSAGYIIQVQVIYMDLVKDQRMTAELAAAGGVGGAIAGGEVQHNIAGGLVGAAIGTVGGAVLGKMVHVDTFLGVVDLWIREKVEGGVIGTVSSNTMTGNSTTTSTTRNIKSDYQQYKTRIASDATQTNIDRIAAANIISDKLATQIAGLF